MTNKLFWQITGILLGLLLLLGLAYAVISANTSHRYSLEMNQRLYGDIASHTVQEVKPLIGGEVDTNAIQDIMHSMMVINPSVEVYLLDTEGKIITYVAPYKKVTLTEVDLTPIKTFITQENRELILGDDPRQPESKNIFSAAAIEKNEAVEGYIYVILASEIQADLTSTLQNSYMLRIGIWGFFTALFLALVIGAIAFWLITRNLNQIIDVVQKFRDGDYKARIKVKKASDLNLMASTFNDMADKIVENIENLKSVENLRKELIANVSHDLRTPLSIMKGYVETLQLKGRTLSPEEKEKYLDIILESTGKLSSLVTQLFEYTKLEANEIKPFKEPFSLNELVQDTLQRYTMILEDRNIDLISHLEKQAPLVFGDVSLIERVISNLMDNAIKFTPKGGTIEVDIVPSEQNVLFKMKDSGPGIEKSEQKYIFERFKQGQVNRHNKAGAGLGLAIAKKILDIHASYIKVESQPNEGASFIFSLPRHLTQKQLKASI